MFEKSGLPGSVPGQPTRTSDQIFIDTFVSSGKVLEMSARFDPCTKACKDYG